MKPLWVQTLVWVAAVLIALVLAIFAPESSVYFGVESDFPQGATAPR
jgi:hypothetical protein